MKNQIVYVEWVDSAMTHGWCVSEKLSTISRIGKCATVGFLVREDDEQLILALNSELDEETSPFGECLAIPKCCLTRRLLLNPDP